MKEGCVELLGESELGVFVPANTMNVQSGAFLQSQDGSFSHFSLKKNANLCTFGSCYTRFTLGDFYGLSAPSATSQSKHRRALTASERLGRSVLFILFKVSYFGAVAQARLARGRTLTSWGFAESVFSPLEIFFFFF